MWASRQDLNREHATLVTDWALPQLRADEFFITLTIILGTFEGRWFPRLHVQKLSTVRQFLLSVPVGQETVAAAALNALRKHMQKEAAYQPFGSARAVLFVGIFTVILVRGG